MPEPGWDPGRESGFLPTTRSPDGAGELMPQLEDLSFIPSKTVLGRGEGATAHRATQAQRVFSARASALPCGVPATPQTKTPTDLPVNKLWQSRSCALLFCGEQGHLDKSWGVERIFVCFVFLVVSVGNTRPFSKPLPFQICPGLHSGDPQPHLPTSCSGPGPNTARPGSLCVSRASTDGQLCMGGRLGVSPQPACA